ANVVGRRSTHGPYWRASVRLLLLELTNHESAMNNRTEMASRSVSFLRKGLLQVKMFFFDLQKTLSVEMNERIYVYFAKNISLNYLVFLYVFFRSGKSIFHHLKISSTYFFSCKTYDVIAF